MFLSSMAGLERVDVGDGDFFSWEDVSHGSYYLNQPLLPVEAVIGVGPTIVVEAGDGGCKDGVPGVVVVVVGLFWFGWCWIERGARRGRDVKSVGGYDAVSLGYSRETATSSVIFGLRGEMEKCRAVGRWKRRNGGCLKGHVIGAQKLVKNAVVDHEGWMGRENDRAARDAGGGDEAEAFAGDRADGVFRRVGFVGGRRGRGEGRK